MGVAFWCPPSRSGSLRILPRWKEEGLGMELSTIVFHMDSQPDFEKLKRRGWYHPLGLRDEPMLSSLMQDFGDYQIHIVHHFPSRDFSYTEAFLHSKPEKPVMLKGEGKGMPLEIALQLVKTLYKECSEGVGS